MTGTEAQSRHNECTTPGAREAKSGARFVPACDYQDRFTEPPHRATEAKQQGHGCGSPILVSGNVTDQPTRAPGTRPTQPAPVAQWIEQAPSKRLAAGSSPAGGAHTLSPAETREGYFDVRTHIVVRPSALTVHDRGYIPRHRGCSSSRRTPGYRSSSSTWGAARGSMRLDHACSAGSRSRSGRAYSGYQPSASQPGTLRRISTVRFGGTEPVIRTAR